MIRVFLVDGQDIVRIGVRTLLDSQPDVEVVGEAATVADGLLGILRTRPNVAILDAALRDGSGIDLCAKIRALAPEVRCLILTSYDDEERVSAAIIAGAAGYVLKQIESSSLVSGIRLVASGHTLIDPEATAHVVQQVSLNRRAAHSLGELTPQQTKILFLIAEGLTNRQIAQELVLAEKTVKNHVTALLHRLGVTHRTQAAVVAMRLREERPQALVPQPRRHSLELRHQLHARG